MRRWLRGLRHRAWALFRRDEWEDGLREELRFHLEMETERLLAEGHRPGEARRIARVRMGGEERMREKTREERGTLFWDRTVQDVRYGLRTVVRAPGFAVVTVLTLALGIGGNTAMFSMVDRVLLRPLPYPEPRELFFLEERTGEEEEEVHSGSVENFRDFRREAASVEALAMVTYPLPVTVLGLEEAVRVPAMGVARDFFAVAGVEPHLGRTLDPAEGRVGGVPEVVVSREFWERYLEADPDPGRRTLTLEGRDARVVGVMPRGFRLLGRADIWYHLEQRPDLPNHRGSRYGRIVGRLGQGISLEAAERELDLVAARIGREFGDQTKLVGVELTPLREVVVGDVRQALWILLGASGFLFLVACTNLAATGLARGTAREREMAVRSALGAGKGRLLRQLFTESLVLSLAGAAAGLGLAWAVVRSVELLAPGALPGAEPGVLDFRAAAWATGLAVGASVLAGVLPAGGLLRKDRGGTLGSGARGDGAGFRRGPWRLLVASEVALVLVLLVGSGLLLRTLGSIVSVDPGYRAEGVVTADIDLPRSLYATPDESAEFYRRLVSELEARPGVTDAGAVLLLPTFAGSLVSGIRKEGEPEPGADGPRAHYRLVEGDYFRTLGIPLLRGRVFRGSDGPGAPHVAVIDESMARRFWPGQDPLGRRFHLGGMDPYRDDWITVVGVVGEARRWNTAPGEQPTYYLSSRQRPVFGWMFGMTVTLMGRAPSSELAATTRDVIRALDPRVPSEIAMLADRVADTWSDRSFNALLLGSFALVGLILAGVGIYGVVAYSVERRRREAGIRMALGARPGQVAWMIRKGGLTTVAVGMTVGTLGAMALSRTLRGLLFGVSPLDPWTFLTAGGCIFLVAWLGAELPARRATRVDPVIAIRAE